MNMKKYLFDRKWVQLLFMAIVLLISSIHVQAQHLHIYGGDNHDVYLGCLTSSPYDSKSIWNEYGTYGNEYISSIHVQAQHLHIYGGDNHDVYLGCLTSSPYDSKSIWNEYGTYGNEYNSKSIWNEYGTYGNEYSSYSPWNEYASNPPVIVDKEGKFYGYFTVNKYKSQRADFYGTYGNEYSSYSPWNEYASNPPVIVDKEGKFYGYFTVNKYKSQRADFKLVLLIYEYRELIKENLQKWYDKLFE